MLRIFLLPALFILAAAAQAPAAGALRFSDGAAAPLLSTDITVEITGPIARTRMVHRFRNQAASWVEGVYEFPLPPDAAVDRLRLRIGDRFVEGVIRERRAAAAAYETARAEGKRAALLEQARPNLFTASVGNIGPHEIVAVEIAFQQTLAPEDGVYAFRLPLVAPPLYRREPVVQQVVFGENGPETAPRTPVRAPDDGALINPVSLSVDLAAGFSVRDIQSPTHDVAVEGRGDRFSIRLDGPVSADRDFVLTWRPQAGGAPELSVYRQRMASRDHALLTIAPPLRAAAAPPPRDVIFVQDVSGSMAGGSMRQARAALEAGLRRLTPEDRFNIIVFSDETRAYAAAPRPATQAGIGRAIEAVRRLEAGGGTEMTPAMRRALGPAGGSAEDRLRQIVFITDGAIGYEPALLRLVAQETGAARLFMVGVGSAPNAYLVNKAAELGRGEALIIRSESEIAERMAALFTRMAAPALTDLRLETPAGVTAHPARLPDLFPGAPLHIALSGPALAGAAILRARRNGREEMIEIPLDATPRRAGVARLYARRRIADLEAAILTGAEASAMEPEILATALDYGLMSRLTSLVAIDLDVARPLGRRLTRAEIARALPAGWDQAAFGFEQPAPPAAAPLRKAAESPARRAEIGVRLPRGALNWRGGLALGLAIMLAGLLLLARGRVRGRGRAA